jgi:hypothetical protein
MKLLAVFACTAMLAVTVLAGREALSQDAPAAAAAAVHAYSLQGAWKLNAAKSDFGDGTKMRDMTLKVTTATPDLVEFSASATYDSGMQGTYSFKGAADGKDYPLTGSASTYSYHEENGALIETQKDPDGTVTKGTWSVSANGKEGIWMYTITNPDASVSHQKLVFIRTA